MKKAHEQIEQSVCVLFWVSKTFLEVFFDNATNITLLVRVSAKGGKRNQSFSPCWLERGDIL